MAKTEFTFRLGSKKASTIGAKMLLEPHAAAGLRILARLQAGRGFLDLLDPTRRGPYLGILG